MRSEEISMKILTRIISNMRMSFKYHSKTWLKKTYQNFEVQPTQTKQIKPIKKTNKHQTKHTKNKKQHTKITVTHVRLVKMLDAGCLSHVCKWTIQEDIWEQEHDTKLERRKLQHFKNLSKTPVQRDPQRKCLPRYVYTHQISYEKKTPSSQLHHQC